MRPGCGVQFNKKFTREAHMNRLSAFHAWALIGLTALVLAYSVLFMRGVRAQDRHHQGHNDYLNWSSGVTENCCNSTDCRYLEDNEVRESSAGTLINIGGQWCPVEQKHRIKKGQSPDWSKYHACVQPDVNYSAGKKAPCDRLLCFVTKGGDI